MNAPRIAHFIRRCGLGICRLAKPFVPEDEARKDLRRLLSSCDWQEKLETQTDRQMAQILAQTFSFDIGTKEDAVIGEAVDRLARSPLGVNLFDANGSRIFGIALSVRLIPNGICDGCGNIGYVCDRSLLCLYCLGLKVSVETWRRKLSQTLRTRFASPVWNPKS